MNNDVWPIFRKKERPRKVREISENLGGIPPQILPFSRIVQGFLKLGPTEVYFRDACSLVTCCISCSNFIYSIR
jgi:hypothetical protein